MHSLCVNGRFFKTQSQIIFVTGFGKGAHVVHTSNFEYLEIYNGIQT